MRRRTPRIRDHGIAGGVIVSLLIAPLVGTLALAAANSPELPSLVLDSERGLVLTELPSVLNHADVKPHLTKGLTTTFIFRVDLLGGGGAGDSGGARIEIRYELWDEVFQVRALEIDGRIEQVELDSHRALAEWWSGTRLTVVPASSEAIDNATRARVTLDVVPFSQAEQADTQEWFSQSISSAELSRTEGTSTSVSGAEKRGSGVFSVLIATSIRSRPLTSFNWTVQLPAVRSP